MVTDELIKEKLPKKEARELLSLSRKFGFPGGIFMLRDGNEKIQEYFKEQKEMLKNFYEWKASPYSIQRQKDVLRVWELYCKVSDDPKACIIHWSKSKRDQRERHEAYLKNDKPPRQDNKTYINYGSRNSNRNKIRYPSKKRKTAWKRFYKLFPHLKPEDES